MTPADMALEDFAGALASGRDLDFDAALGMARTAASDPLTVSKRTGVQLPDSASAEDFLVGNDACTAVTGKSIQPFAAVRQLFRRCVQHFKANTFVKFPGVARKHSCIRQQSLVAG